MTLYAEVCNGNTGACDALWCVMLELTRAYTMWWCQKLSLSLAEDELYDVVMTALVKEMDSVLGERAVRDISGLVYYSTSNALRARRIYKERVANMLSVEFLRDIEIKNDYLRWSDDVM